MPESRSFVDVILAQAQKVKTETTTSASTWFSSSKPLTKATSDFLTELENAGVVWHSKSVPIHLDSSKRKSKSKRPIAIALFRYCVNRHASETPQENKLYQDIMNCAFIYSIEGEEEQTHFLEDLVHILAQVKTINNPVALLNDLAALTDILFERFSAKEKSQNRLILTEHFVNQLILKLPTCHEILYVPLFMHALKHHDSMGVLLIEKIISTNEENTNTSQIIKHWLHLLKNEMIRPFEKIANKNFMQHWFEVNKKYHEATLHNIPGSNVYAAWEGFFKGLRNKASLSLPFPESTVDGLHSAATSIATLIDANVFEGISPMLQAQLFSLPYYDTSSGCLTGLQVLSSFYLKQGKNYPAIVERLIIDLLQINPAISIEHEKRPFWIETLQEGLRHDVCLKIVAHIPEKMKKEFQDKHLHTFFTEDLHQKLKTEDFWTQPLKEKQSEKNRNLCQIILAIRPNTQNGVIDEAQASIDAFHENHQMLDKCLISGGQWPEPPSIPSLFNSDPIKTFKEKIALIDNMPVPNEEHHSLFFGLMAMMSAGVARSDFLHIYFYTNLVLYFVKLAITPETTMVKLTLTGENSGISDYYQNEIKKSIHKSLTYFAQKFYWYSEQDIMINLFIILNENIAAILDGIGLKYKDIVLDHPPTRAILKNIYVTLFLFDEKNQQKSAPYQAIEMDSDIDQLSHIRNDASPETKIEILSFLEQLENAATAYQSEKMSGAANIYKGENKLNRSCVNSILVNIKEKEPSETPLDEITIRLVKDLLVIIHYRISSFDEEKYEKSFYSTYLKNLEVQLFKNQLLKNVLQHYKPFFIAQINLSLRRIEIDHLSQESVKEKALSTYLSTLRLFFEISTVDLKKLDEHTQDIFDCFDEKNICEFSDIHNRKLIARLMKKHREGQVYTQTDVEIIINHMPFVCAEDLFDIEYVQAALCYKTEDFSAVDTYLEHLYRPLGNGESFRRAWIFCLQKGLSKQIEFRNIPLIAYYYDGTQGLYTALFKLDNSLQKKIINASYKNSDERPISLPQYSDSKLESNHVPQIDATKIESTNNTFNLALWGSALYDLKKIPAGCTFSAIEHHVFNLLRPYANISDNISIIGAFLVIGIEYHKPEHSYGTWLEILLFAICKASEKQKEFFITCILPKIPNEMLKDLILNAKKRDAIINLLSNEIDPFADSPDDMLTYELYFLVLLQATVRCEKYLASDDPFIPKLCKLLIRFPEDSNFFQYVENQYKNLALLQPTINQILKKEIALHPLIPSNVIKILNKITGNDCFISDDNSESILMLKHACCYIKDTLFLSVSAFPLQQSDADFLEALGKFHCSRDALTVSSIKLAIYTSVQKSIAYVLHNAPHKWHNAAFRNSIINLLHRFATQLQLDPSKLLPENHDVLIDHCLLAQSKEAIGLTSNATAIQALTFITDEANKSKHTNPCVPDHQMNILDTFMSQIMANAFAYASSLYHQNKMGNTLSTHYAKMIAKIEYAYKDNFGKKEAFFQALLCIITYRISSYSEEKYDKSFFNDSFKPPLLALKDQLELSRSCKQQLYYEITALLDRIEPYDNLSSPPVYQQSLNDTLTFFTEIFELEDPHFKVKTDRATKVSTTLASYQNSISSGSARTSSSTLSATSSYTL